MANLLYLVGAVVAIAVICGVLYLRNRRPRSMASDIDSFRRELRALSPDRRPPPGRVSAPDREPDGRRSG